MWTINDFPAYGMLSGWGSHGKLACPYFMEHGKAFTLRYGGKSSWFNSHRRFLDSDHPFRRNVRAFKQNQTEEEGPPPLLTPEQIWGRVRDLPKVTEAGVSKLPGYGE